MKIAVYQEWYTTQKVKNKMNNISFKAQFINNTTVRARNENGKYIDKSIAVVKMNPNSKLDYNSVQDISQLWGDEETYVKSMLNHYNIIVEDQKRSIYIVTEQSDNFRKLLPEKVLGMIEVSKYNNFSRIDFIQTKPQHAYKSRKRNYKNIGWAMLSLTERIYGDKKIILNSVRKAVEFYKKYGFVVSYEKCNNPLMTLKRAKV